MNQFSKAIKAISSSREQLLSIAYELEKLGYAFISTGNTKVGGNLLNMATRIESCEDTINKAESEFISYAVLASQQHSATVFEGVMAGIALSQKASTNED